jgi:hypothetical protein
MFLTITCDNFRPPVYKLSDYHLNIHYLFDTQNIHKSNTKAESFSSFFVVLKHMFEFQMSIFNLISEYLIVGFERMVL